METLLLSTPTTEEVMDHHLQALLNNDVNEVMKDYTDESEIWTSEGIIHGLDDIASFFSYIFTVLPRGGTQLGLKQKIVKDNRSFIVWNAHSPVISIPTGADTFIIEDGKIVLQTVATHIVSR
ncbi:MAG TPA: nuclear transport factor 2 family protein [Chitinophagaceae bacterium]|nr:nuclear transport factor 2 family protein [Chitinophagaceae bacterium]